MKYYIIVASKDHVKKGEKEGFAQAGHGKKHQLNKLKKNDWIIYYSSKETYGDQKPYQRFTAIGQVIDNVPFQVQVSDSFEPWRRAVNFQPSREVEIRALIRYICFYHEPKTLGTSFYVGLPRNTKSRF